MIFYPEWFGSLWIQAAWLPLILLLGMTARRALAAIQQYRTAAALAVMLLATAWSLTATTDSGTLAGISYHLLAVNLAALMLGAPAVCWIAALLMLPYVWLHTGSLATYPLNTLLLLLPPLAVNLTARYCVNRLPPNIFIFIFLNGFLASAAGIVFTGLLLTAFLSVGSGFADGGLWGNAFPVFFLIAWAEAFLSGIATAIFIALKPQWISTFDDNRYLKRQNRIWQD
ncbi:energy-coupling factor ABC transporter permease [Neisseria animalis]|uniref:Uncharacterized protein n=1 Tax=Neisseria animalis TaxID=492 RepID=A0A5P3MSW7_NEIAN|nr:energy-coupling factor ABC transporter permease [Neisseria animalis]QEY24706.1 hypothetical protein D0T90_09715 [Neisseria animalis]ROW31700.1 hypothetical protein CGZ60_09010 [Neisseria animalis]VEE07898.1 integral membrane protein [Neisseria animalis]